MPILSLDVVWQARFPDSACSVQISEVLRIRNAHAPLLTCLPDKHWGKRRHTVSSFWASFRSFIYFFNIQLKREFCWNHSKLALHFHKLSSQAPHKSETLFVLPCGIPDPMHTPTLELSGKLSIKKKQQKKRREGGREYYQCLYLYSFRTLGSIESK